MFNKSEADKSSLFFFFAHREIRKQDKLILIKDMLWLKEHQQISF